MAEPASSISPSGLGVSGFYDDADGVVFNPIHDDNVDNTRETIPKDTPRFTKSGDYTSRIESSYQVDNDLKGSLKSPRVDYVHTEETSNDISDNGLRSSHTGTEQTRTDSGGFIPSENVTIFKDSWKPDDRGSGIYSTKIESTEHDNRQSMQNSDDHSRSSRISQSRRLGATTLSTMTEEDENALYPRDRSDMRSSWARNSRESSTDNYNYNSNSMEKNGAPPVWTEMIFNPGFNEAYLQKAWPRIALQFQRNNRPSDPFVPGDHEDLDNLKKPKKDCSIFLKCWIWWTVVVLAVGITLVVIFLSRKDESASKVYVTADMTMTVNEQFKAEYNSTDSKGYKTFTNDFCSEVGKAYINSVDSKAYHGCEVTSLSQGSIIVFFKLYFTAGIAVTDVNMTVKVNIEKYINDNSERLGRFLIITGSFSLNAVTTQSLSVPPNVQGDPTRATTPTTTTTPETPTTITPTNNPPSDQPTSSSTSTNNPPSDQPTSSSTSTNNPPSNQPTSSSTSTSNPSEQPTSFSTSTNNPPSEQPTTATMTSTNNPPSDQPTSTSTSTNNPPSDQPTSTSTSTNNPLSDQPTSTSTSTNNPPSDQPTSTSTSTNNPLSDQPTSTSTSTTNTPSGQPTSTSTSTNNPPSDQSTASSTSTTNPSDQPTASLTSTTNPSDQPTSTLTSTSSPSEQPTASPTPTTNPSDQPTSTLTPTNNPPSNQPTSTSTSTSSSSEQPTASLTSTTNPSDQPTSTLTATNNPPSNQPTSTSTSTSSHSEQPTSSSTSMTNPQSDQPTSSLTSTNNPPLDQPTSIGTSTIYASDEPTSSSTSTTNPSDQPTSISTSTSNPSEQPTSSSTSTTNPSSEQPTFTWTSTSSHSTDISLYPTEITSHITDTTSHSTKTTAHSTEFTAHSTETTAHSTETTAHSTETTSSTSADTNSPSTSQVSYSTEIPTVTTGTTVFSQPPSTDTVESTTNPTVSTTNSKEIEIVCSSLETLQLFEGPVRVTCNVSDHQVLENHFIHVYHNGGQMNSDSVFDMKYYWNGTVFEGLQDNSDIHVEVSDNTIAVRFDNVSCLFIGTFNVGILRGSTEEASSNFVINVQDTPAQPVITLNPDQVIDLIFNDDVTDFYRTTGIHTCEGSTGFSLSNWMLDITYDNGTSFTDFPDGHLVIPSRTNVTNSCTNSQKIEFAIKFTESMQNARVRCWNPDKPLGARISDELRLIPRNICDCGDSSSARGHPYDCNVRVTCTPGGSKMFPTGERCAPSFCRNSISGECSSNCSDAVCDEPVPPSFCEVPLPPTTTPAPSPYMSCNDVTAQLDSGLVSIVCTLNGSSDFNTISVAFRRLGEVTNTDVALISSDGSIVIYNSDYTVSLLNDIITITTNTTCELEGSFWVTMNVNETSVAPGFSKFSLTKDPEKPILTLNADQVINLGFYRAEQVHTCEAVVGYPIQDLVVEMLYANASVYVELNSSQILIKTKENTPDTCKRNQKIEFGILFTENMVNAKVRCRVSGIDSINTTSDEQAVYLIPRTICDCGSGGVYRGHPDRCDRHVVCISANSIMFPMGAQCDPNTCRDSLTGECGKICTDELCGVEVPADFCTTTTPTTTTPKPVTEISCNDTSALVNTGPIEMTCYLNFTTLDSINIFYMNGTTQQLFSTVIHNNTITVTNSDSNVEVMYSNNILTIKVLIAGCDYTGIYPIEVEDRGDIYPSRVKLDVYSPASMPFLNVPHDTFENVKKTITCSAVIGKSDWSIQLWTRQAGSDNFVIPSTDLLYGKPTYNSDQCIYERKVELNPQLSASWNKTDVRCIVSDGMTAFNESDPSLISEKEIVIIKDDYCLEDEPDVYKFHPRGCSYYIRCVSGTEYSYECGATTCFNFNGTSPCVFCTEAPFPCNGTLS